jgi:hypothetical protein
VGVWELVVTVAVAAAAKAVGQVVLKFCAKLVLQFRGGLESMLWG